MVCKWIMGLFKLTNQWYSLARQIKRKFNQFSRIENDTYWQNIKRRNKVQKATTSSENRVRLKEYFKEMTDAT